MRTKRLYETPEWLYSRYWEENLSTRKMGALCNVGARTIKRHLRKNDIPRRSLSGAKESHYGVSPYKNRSWLYKKYWKKNLTLKEVAILCGRDRKTVSAWFTEFDIPKRTMAEARANKKKKPTWRSRLIGGIERILKKSDSFVIRRDN